MLTEDTFIAFRDLSGSRRAAKACMWQYACKGAEACTMMCQVCLSSCKQCCHISTISLYLEVYVFFFTMLFMLPSTLGNEARIGHD
jgi:hypothetical protein